MSPDRTSPHCRLAPGKRINIGGRAPSSAWAADFVYNSRYVLL